MIGQVRAFIKGVIVECDSTLKQHHEYFTSENIADTKMPDTYFIKMGEIVDAEQPEQVNFSVLPVTIELYKNGGNDIIAKLDDAYSKAIDIKAALTDKTRIEQTGYIKKVSSSGVIPEPIESNDNAGKFTIQLQVTLAYKA